VKKVIWGIFIGLLIAFVAVYALGKNDTMVLIIFIGGVEAGFFICDLFRDWLEVDA